MMFHRITSVLLLVALVCVSVNCDNELETNEESNSVGTSDCETKNYEVFDESSIVHEDSSCKLPEDKISKNGCSNSYECKCHGFPNYTGHPDYCQGDDQPCPAYSTSCQPSCPNFGHQETMPWSCYPYPCLTPYCPYYPPTSCCNQMPYNSTSCPYGYGFGPQFPLCGPRNINRCSLENALKDHKSFEKFKNCTYT